MKINQLQQKITYLLLFFFFGIVSLHAKEKILRTPVDLSSLSPPAAIDTLSSLAAQFFKKEHYSISLEYLHQALSISETLPDQYQYIDVCVSIGRIYYLTNNYTLSQDFLFRALKNKTLNVPQSVKSDIYSLLASGYNSLGDVSAAHEYRLKSIEIDEVLKDTTSLASNYYNLGSLYFYQGIYTKALEYYEKTNVLAYQMNSLKVIYNTTAAIGSTYERIGNIELALQLHKNSLNIADSLNYLTGQAYALGNIGSAYLELGDYTKAQDYTFQSLTLKREIGDEWGLIGTYVALSNLYIKTKKYKLAEEHVLQALDIAKKIKAHKRVADIYRQLADLYTLRQQSEKAFEYLNKYVVAQDSLMNENVLREMSDRKTQMATQKKAYEIDLLKKDNKILEAEKRTQRYKLAVVGLLSIFFLVVSLVFRSLLSKQKDLTQLLQTKNDKIKNQRNKIQNQNKKLITSNEDLKQFAYVASHDLREPLRMITSYGKILTRRYKDTLDKSGQEFLFFMTDAATRMDALLLDLLSYAKTSADEQPFEAVNTADLIESVSRVMEGALLEKNATIEIETENFPIIAGRKTQLHQLFQNFISNGLKYNLNENPHITIDCITNEKEHIFSFTDNGIGIPEEHQVKIFEMFQRLHAKGEFEGTGIGLATCKKIADIHHGRITVQSKEGAEVLFTFICRDS